MEEVLINVVPCLIMTLNFKSPSCMNQVIVFPGGSQFDLWPFNVPNTISTPSVCRYYHGVWWLEWLPVTPVSGRGVTANEILSKKYWFIRQHNPLTVLCPVNCQEKCISGCQNVHSVPHHAFLLSDALQDHTHRTVLILAHRGLLPIWEVWVLLWLVQHSSACLNRGGLFTRPNPGQKIASAS